MRSLSRRFSNDEKRPQRPPPPFTSFSSAFVELLLLVVVPLQEYIITHTFLYCSLLVDYSLLLIRKKKIIMLLKLFSIPIVFLAIAVGYLFNDAPWLFGQKIPSTDDKKKKKYIIMKNIPELDDELFPLSKVLGPDFGRYRNHCMRVLTFTNYFLPELSNKPKMMELATVALAYHDIGLWVGGGKLDYLKPSMDKLYLDLKDDKGFTEHELDVMKEIIDQHHRLTPYPHNPNFTSAENSIIEAVRKGDLADFSLGIVRNGIPRDLIEQTFEEIPNIGFHKTLSKMPMKLSPGNVVGMFDIFKIFKW